LQGGSQLLEYPLLLLVCGGFTFYYRANMAKVIAPRLRKKRSNDDPLAAFVSSDAMPMEENDPELTMNPVLIAQMQMQKESKRKQKAAKGIAVNKSGGLARLGIQLQREDKVDPKVKVGRQMDMYLTSMGVEGPDSAKDDYGGPRGPEAQRKLQKDRDRLKAAKSKGEFFLSRPGGACADGQGSPSPGAAGVSSSENVKSGSKKPDHTSAF